MQLKFSVLLLTLVGALSCTGCKNLMPTVAQTESVVAIKSPIATTDPVNIYNADLVKIISRNSEAFDSKLQIINSAKNTLDVAYFLYTPSFTTSALSHALIMKAKEGVKVRLIVSALGATNDRDYFRAMMEAGNGNLEVTYFRPLSTKMVNIVRSWGFSDPDSFLQLLVRVDAVGWFKKVTTFATNRKLQKDFFHYFGFLNPLQDVQDFAAEVKNITTDYSNSKSFDQIQAGLATRTIAGLESTADDLSPIVDISKIMHHKLLIADREMVQGGGRNMGDEYNVDENDELYNRGGNKDRYWDTDFVVHSKDIANEALKTFNSFWACNQEANCDARIVMTHEYLEAGKTYLDSYKKIVEASATFRQTRPATPSNIEAIPTIVAHNVNVSYVENRMFPGDTERQKNLIFHEELSHYQKLWVDLINATPAGESIIFNNYGIYLTPDMLNASMAAIRRGVHFTFVSNSANLTGGEFFMPALTFQQQQALTKFGTKQSNPVDIRQLNTDAMLHSKITVLGDHILVGSTNADPRSQYLDSQNGLWILPGSSVEVNGMHFANPAKAYEYLYRAHMDRLSNSTTVLRGNTYQSLEKVDGQKIMQQIQERRSPLSRLYIFQRIVDALQDLGDQSITDGPAGEQARQVLNNIYFQL